MPESSRSIGPISNATGTPQQFFAYRVQYAKKRMVPSSSTFQQPKLLTSMETSQTSPPMIISSPPPLFQTARRQQTRVKPSFLYHQVEQTVPKPSFLTFFHIHLLCLDRQLDTVGTISKPRQQRYHFFHEMQPSNRLKQCFCLFLPTTHRGRDQTGAVAYHEVETASQSYYLFYAKD